MALFKCPECSKKISDKADACIHCGYPLSRGSSTEPAAKKESERFFGVYYYPDRKWIAVAEVKDANSHERISEGLWRVTDDCFIAVMQYCEDTPNRQIQFEGLGRLDYTPERLLSKGQTEPIVGVTGVGSEHCFRIFYFPEINKIAIGEVENGKSNKTISQVVWSATDDCINALMLYLRENTDPPGTSTIINRSGIGRLAFTPEDDTL